ncbi:chemotaxis protein CheB [bacterium]|nr:chemotaxis protein CheB [bacterium]
MIKVLIVDDSPTARSALRLALEKDHEILVIGEAKDGQEMMQLVHKTDPDIITMDVYLKHENGLDLTAQIMKETPRPIVIITGINPDDPQLSYKALERGALDVFAKLPSPKADDYEQQSQKLRRMIKILAAVPVLHQKRSPSGPGTIQATVKPPVAAVRPPRVDADYAVKRAIVLVGASTGGPPLIAELLAQLSSPCPLPIIIVQHISKGFAQGFAEWLGQVSGHRVVLVKGKQRIEPGTVYVAPDEKSIYFASAGFLNILDNDQSDKIKPSIDVLFNSAAQLLCEKAISILLTGMGRDGSQGLQALYEAGSLTIAQTPDTCTVDSMPRHAIELGVAQLVLTPREIVRLIEKEIKLS